MEAARTAIVSEIGNVFRVYGISVDYRHLALIADYMVTPFTFFKSYDIARLSWVATDLLTEQELMQAPLLYSR